MNRTLLTRSPFVPFGTRAQVKVRRVVAWTIDNATRFTLHLSEVGTARSFIANGGHEPRPKINSVVTIIYTEGGPLGGFWKLEKTQDQPA